MILQQEKGLRTPLKSMPSNEIATRFEGRFTSGETAGSEEVDLRLEELGISISRPGVAEPVIWPYAALASGEPLSEHAIDALLTYKQQPGATLYVPGSAFVRKLGEFAPHLTRRSQVWKVVKYSSYAAASILLVVFAVWALNLSPAYTVATLLPDDVRTSIGKQVVRTMSEDRGICTDETGRAALDKLARRLSKASDSSALFSITVVNWELMNAFAAPGEQIVVTRELITAAKSPDELAAVLAHEMGHGIRLHPETSIVRGIGLAAAAELLFGGTSGSLANFGIALTQLSYSRDAEREADQQGLRILKAAGISPKGMTDFFDRMSKLENPKKSEFDFDDTPEFFSTHPPTRERIQRVKNQPKYDSSPALSNADWADLKQICKNLPEPMKRKKRVRVKGKDKTESEEKTDQ